MSLTVDYKVLETAIKEEMDQIQNIIDKYQKKLNELKRFMAYIDKQKG